MAKILAMKPADIGSQHFLVTDTSFLKLIHRASRSEAKQDYGRFQNMHYFVRR